MRWRLRAAAEGLAVVTGLAFAAASLRFPDFASASAGSTLASVLLAGLVLWIAWQDVVSLTLPDGPLAALALVALAERAADPMIAFDPVLGLAAIGLDAALAGGSVLLVREIYFRRRGEDGIGFGDVKLSAAGGLLCGLSGFATALFLASLAGLAVALVARRVSPAGFSGKLPFGAFLAPALGGVWMLSP